MLVDRLTSGPSPSPHLQSDETKTVWRSGQHEFNSDTSDGTWGFSQFVSVASLHASPGFLTQDGSSGEEALVVRCGVIVRWKREGADGPGAVGRDSGRGTRDPGSGTRDPGPGTRDPGPGTREHPNSAASVQDSDPQPRPKGCSGDQYRPTSVW